jgi:hypothetical protein
MAGEGQREGRREGGRSDRRPELIVLVTIDVELLRVEDVLIRGLNLSDGFVVNINFFLFGIDAFLHQHQLVEDLGNRLSKKMSMVRQWDRWFKPSGSLSFQEIMK